ncbi:MAG: hypothetical protein GQE15_28810 [Archangiaceae bacterium]|nr:hypothetical protein [Archangiaceae bacterium]
MQAALEQAWQAVRQTPDDVSRLEVLADLLLQEESAFGELLRLELERERVGGTKLTPRIDRERRAIASGLRHEIADAEWVRGFVRSTTGKGTAVLRRVLAHPAFRLLRVAEWGFGVGDSLDAIDATLAELPATLVELRLTGRNLEAGALAWPNQLGRLHTLVANLPISLAGVSAGELRALHFHPVGLDSAQFVRSLEHVWFPKLAELSLTLEPTSERWPASFLAGDRTPTLKRLWLQGALMPEHVEELASSGLLRGLEELSLGVQHLPQFDMIFSDTADRFEHLKRFIRPTPR